MKTKTSQQKFESLTNPEFIKLQISILEKGLDYSEACAALLGDLASRKLIKTYKSDLEYLHNLERYYAEHPEEATEDFWIPISY